jgi:hypothetical protein
MIFMDEILDDKWKWMNFFMNIGKILFLQKTKQKKQDGKNYVGLFWKIEHMKCWSHALGYIKLYNI